MKQKFLNSLRLRLYALVAIVLCSAGTVWGETVTLTQSGLELTGSYTSNTEKTIAGITYVYTDLMKSSDNIQAKASTGTIYNKTAFPGDITSVAITHSGTGRATTILGSSDGTNWTQVATGSGSITADFSGKGYKYFKITRGSNAAYWTKIEVSYSTSPTCANPTFSLEEGPYSSPQSVTISSDTDDAKIYYTTDGTTPTEESTEYTDPISVSETATIKAIAIKNGFNNSGVSSATYVIVGHAGTETDPYTVADARAILTEFPTQTFENVFVSGIVSQVDSYNANYQSITYWISDDGTTTDQFEVYGGLLKLNDQEFTSKDDLIVGSEVTVKGNIKKYNSTFEFDSNSVIVSLTAPIYPIINTTTNAIELAYDATSGEIVYTITNPDDGVTLSATPTAEWISDIIVGESSVTFTTTANEDEEDRTATITLSYEGADDVTITVTQKHYVIDYAELPFEYKKGSAAIATTVGLTQSGLGSDYSSAPYLKFDSTGDYVILKINERPGILSFDLKGNGFNDGTFTVQISNDGVTFSELQSYNNTQIGSTTQNETFSNLDENVRYIKWIFTRKGTGNVALGNIKVTKYVMPQEYTLTVSDLTNVNIYTFAGDESEMLFEGEGEGQVYSGTEVMLSVDPEEGYVLESLMVDGVNHINDIDGGMYLFTMPTHDVTVTATAVEEVMPPTATYNLATSITPGKRYVIANGTEDGTVQVMAGQNSNNRAAADATISDGKLTTLEEYEFVVEGATGGCYTIFDESYGENNKSGYLYAASSSSNYLRTKEVLDNNGIWKIEIDPNNNSASIIAQGTNTRKTMRYNSNSNVFSCYAEGQNDVYLFEKVEGETKTATFTISKNCYDVNGESKMYYGTYSNTSAFVVPSDLTVSKVSVDDGTLTVTDFAAGDIIPANTGVMVSSATYGAKTVALTEESISDTGDNMLRPTGNSGIDADAMAAADPGCKYYRLTMYNGTEIGFWWGAEDGAAFDLGPNKAYLAVPLDANGSIKGIAFSDIVDCIKAVENEKSESNVIYNLSGQRVSKMQKGIYVVNGKKVLVK